MTNLRQKSFDQNLKANGNKSQFTKERSKVSQNLDNLKTTGNMYKT